MRQYERKWIGPFTAHVNEVDADTVNISLEVRELVERHARAFASRSLPANNLAIA